MTQASSLVCCGGEGRERARGGGGEMTVYRAGGQSCRIPDILAGAAPPPASITRLTAGIAPVSNNTEFIVTPTDSLTPNDASIRRKKANYSKQKVQTKRLGFQQ